MGRFTYDCDHTLRRRADMPKYICEAKYNAEGKRGLLKDKASGRREVVEKMFSGLGGKMESMYFCFGDSDVIIIGELPDNTAAAAVSAAVGASGLVDAKIVVLLTVAEMDQALSKVPEYRRPGA
jgi:uncharacterized protein with GYD domain